MKFIVLFVFAYLTFAHAQQNIDKLNVNQLKLPKESVSRALLIDATGQVKASSSVTDTELSYLDGLNNTLVNLLNGKANDSDVFKLTGEQSASGVKTFTGKLVASSTVNGSTPCPVMTETQRNAFTPVQGDCVYNSTTLKLNVFDGSVWKDAGGAGGISLWLTANPYNINDIVIQSDKIYRCLIAHTSGTFATDLSANRWVEVSSSPVTPYSLANGGTGKALTAVSGGIVWVDSDSFEVLSAGVSGQVLRSNGASSPSWEARSVPGKSQYDTTQTVEEIQVPNNQLTQTALNRHLIESGNQNILSNPSFEHATFSTGWTTATGGTPSENLVNEVHGLKAYSITLSAALSVRQDSTLYASEFNGSVQGLASIRVKSSNVVTLCARQAGVTSTSLCVPSRGSNTWELLRVPFILSATSNGLNVSTTATSGTVLLDDAFVGPTSLTQEMNACNSLSCETEFSAVISSTGTVTSESGLDWISGNCTNAFPNVCTFNASIFTVTPSCTVVSVAGTQTVSANISAQSTSSVSIRNSTNASSESTAFNLICQKQGADFTAAKQLSNGNTYSSNNSDTDWAPCQFSTLAWQGLGTVTNSLQCKRQGSDLLISGSLVLGTVSASAAQIPMPLWNGSQLAARSTANNITLGRIARSSSTASAIKDFTAVLTNVTTSVIQISAPEFSSTLNPLAAQNGSTLFANGEQLSFENIRVSIQFWENSNIIIGQFNGLESCQDSYQCTDTFSAKISSSGVVSDENLDFISGNCSVSGSSVYTCTLVNGLRGGGQNLTSGMNCSVSPNADGVGTQFVSVNGSSTTTLTFATVFNSGTGNRPFSIVCQKAGADYIAKSAKAVSSDQNVATPGQVKAVLVSALVTDGASTTTVSQDDSDFINGNCTNPSAGNYTCTFNTNYFTGQPHCWVQGSGNSRFSLAGSISSSSASFVFADSATTASDIGQFYLFCKGTRQ